MGILTLGLLGVAAIFPVGSFYVQKAVIADGGSAIGQAVMSDIMARGMLNPRTWRVMVPLGTPIPLSADRGTSGTFTRPYGPALDEVRIQPAVLQNRALLVQQFGSAFILDPMGVAAMAFPNGFQPTWNGIASAFPATAHDLLYGYNSPLWQPWGQQWPVRRVTFQSTTSKWQMDAVTADHYFRGSDDLATDLPERDDRPAEQLWEGLDQNGDGKIDTPLAQQWSGDYSWIVTVVPTSHAALEGMARNPESFAYDVSVVVFYKRVLPEDALTAFNLIASSGNQLKLFRDAMGDQERAVKACIVSTGLNGGELLLKDLGDNLAGKSPFRDLRVGQWLMLCGPHPNSTSAEPRFSLNWYQVLSIDAERAAGVINDSAKERVIAVRGPQWPWQPAPSLTNNPQHLSNSLCVAICRGAVAVHTKTLRLEGQSGSVWGISSSTTSEPPGNVGVH
jgi:hypothetical protein